MVDPPSKEMLLAVGGVLLVLFVWSYWPTLVGLVERWSNTADYSHGFLVAPLAVGFLWARRDLFPHGARGIGWAALAMAGVGLAIRITGARCFLPSFDGWSIPFWLASACLLFGGWRLLRWCLPSLIFLFFMVPLPYRAESALSVPLRHVATKLSCTTLQCLGQPAVMEGTTIILGDQKLDVARECSGLRMLMGIMALATAYVVLVRKPWWQKALLLASVVPVAVAANVLRVTATSILLHYVSGQGARDLSHDAAGWVTNCIAAALFAAILWGMHHLFVETETFDKKELFRKAGDLATT